ncbi:hypothetical protein Tco_0715435 [Tanacetum coccineum]
MFANYVADKNGFLETVNSVWDKKVKGYVMYRVVQKLKQLKKPLNILNWSNGNLFEKVVVLRDKLKEAQSVVDVDPFNNNKKEVAVHLFEEYTIAAKDEIKLLHQKIKIKWLKEGDRNIAYFHRVLKSRKHKSRVESICREDGKRYVGNEVSHQFVNHFNMFLGTSMLVVPLNSLGDIVKLKLADENKKIYNYARNVAVTASHVIGDAVMKIQALENQLLSVSLLDNVKGNMIVERIPSATSWRNRLSEQELVSRSCTPKVPHHGIDLWLQVQIFYDHVNPVTRPTIDQSASGKLRDLNAEESWALLEDLALYDNKIWNDPKDFAKPVKAIALPQDVLSTSDRRLIELENQVQRLMEAHLAPIQPTQVNKITTPCEICSGPHDTQYCLEDPEQAFVKYTSSRTDEVGGKRFTPNHGPRNFNDATNTWKEKPNFNSAHT